MDFREKYKNEMSGILPGEAASERIRAGVMKRLAEPPKKAPIPFGRIAAIGASAAACLAIGFSALTAGRKVSEVFSGNAASPQQTYSAGEDRNDNAPAAEPNGGANDRTDAEDNNRSTADGTASERIFIRFDENGFTLSGSEKHYTYASNKIDGVNKAPSVNEPAPAPPEASPSEYVEAFTEDGERFFLKFYGGSIVLLNEDMETVGIYVSG